VSTLTIFFNTVLEILARALKQVKEINEINIGNEKVKLSLDVILHSEIPKHNQSKLRTDKFSKVA
jgi:hypothetical protein